MDAEKPSPDTDPDNRKNTNLATQFDDPATAKRAERRSAGTPAQVTPEMKKKAERHPEDFPPPGDMGPPEGVAD